MRQVEQSQAASSGACDVRCTERVMRTRPVEVKAVPCHAIVVGITQSNMSTPQPMARSRSGGVPTPMR